MNNNQKLLRERIYKYYLDNKFEGKILTTDHFKSEKIYKIIINRRIAEKESGHERFPGSGQMAKVTTKNIRYLKVIFDHEDGISQLHAAQKFKYTQSYISKTSKKKITIKRSHPSKEGRSERFQSEVIIKRQ